MPSPSIPRPVVSNPNISKTLKSRSGVGVAPSACSSRSSSSSKSSWGPKIVTKFIYCKKSGLSDLTEESLDAHNKRQQIIEDRNAKCSPYYKGLTDSSLVVGNKHKLPTNTPYTISSPGRESHATTVATVGSFSSFISKMQEWTPSCFGLRRKGDDYHAVPAASTVAVTTTTVVVKDVVFETKNGSGSVSLPAESDSTTANSLVKQEKPLRERVTAQTVLVPAPILTAHKIVVEKVTNERVFVLADKYRPMALRDFICNRDKALQLQGLVKAGECTHFIFEGPPGVGKRTMIWSFLRETFGADRVQTREECKEFDLKGESIGSIQVNVKASSQHVEVNLSELKGYEKHVIVELIKERHNKVSNKALQSGYNCRAIILYEADKLSTDALLYIRWLLERYKGYNKVFFCCSDVSKLQPIKTLCTIVQLFPPSNKEIVEVLEFIAKEEGIELPHQFAEKIAEKSKNNLRQAIRSFEATWQINYSFKEDHVIMTGWEDDIANIAKNIVEEQSPKQLYVIRGKLQNLIEHNVSPDFIFKTLVEELKKHLNETLKLQVDSLYEEYSRDDGSAFDSEKPSVFGRNRHEEMGKWHNDPLKKNVQLFMRIEEFIAKIMSCYKSCSLVTSYAL